jgi:hypothetical protein
MKAFTLDLSKEAMLFLQNKLPKGYSLVRGIKEGKKEANSFKFSNISADSANYDLPSEEFEPPKSLSKPKISKIPPSKVKKEPKLQTTKKETKAQTTKIQDDKITSNKPETSLKKSKKVFYCLF